MVGIEEDELHIFLINYTRNVIRNKNYNTSKWVKIFKKYYRKVSKDTQKLLKNEINGRRKQLEKSNKNIKQEHYYKSYLSVLDWIKEIENANQTQNQNSQK